MNTGSGVKTFRRKAESQLPGEGWPPSATSAPQPLAEEPPTTSTQLPKTPNKPVPAQLHRRNAFGLSSRRCSVLVPPVDPTRLAQLSGLLQAADPLAGRKASRKQQHERRAVYLRSALELAMQYEEVRLGVFLWTLPYGVVWSS